MEVTMMLSCPIPTENAAAIQLGHGGGGALMHRLLDEVILPEFSNKWLARQHDGAVFEAEELGGRVAFTTDSYVVKPLFFPGGDIGSMAVYGTVNDLAMCGARARYLSVGLIIEEGFSTGELRRVVRSMRDAAERAGVFLVTGDTKVVDRGNGDGLFVNTSGIGVVGTEMAICPWSVEEGDVVILSGDIGRHGVAIMAAREGLEFDTEVLSDCAPLNGVVEALLESGVEIHCLRDLTRGGLATALKEIAMGCGREVVLDEVEVPVCEEVRGACEMLGLDPLYVANEGTMVAVVPGRDAGRALAAMRGVGESAGSVVVGEVTGERGGRVILKSVLGTRRLLDLLAGEQLPRIC